jgi:hypothetical protein
MRLFFFLGLWVMVKGAQLLTALEAALLTFMPRLAVPRASGMQINLDPRAPGAAS